MSKAAATPDRRIADVCIGDVYRVYVSNLGRSCPVEILERASSGIWYGLNRCTGSELCVAFSDLGEKLPGRVATSIHRQKTSRRRRERRRMRITISEVGGLADAINAQGIAALFGRMGYDVTLPVALDGECPRPVVPEIESPKPRRGGRVPRKVTAAPKAAKRGRPKKQALPVKAKPPAGAEAPRVTIRQRVVDIIKAKPRFVQEIHLELVKQGIPDSVDTSQHCYLAKRDGLIRQDDDGRYRAA